MLITRHRITHHRGHYIRKPRRVYIQGSGYLDTIRGIISPILKHQSVIDLGKKALITAGTSAATFAGTKAAEAVYNRIVRPKKPQGKPLAPTKTKEILNDV